MSHCHTVANFLYAVLTVAAASSADTLVLKNGQRYEGRLVSADEHLVVFEVQTVGVAMVMRRPAAEVETILREEQSGPSFSVLPIVGSIGRDDEADSYVTAEAFRRALARIRTVGPDYVILAIDSPGGSTAETKAIVNAIGDATELEFIAYVRNAYSAAAVIAMACPRIFMEPSAGIGAAVPYQVGPNGIPREVQEKQLSAIRAEFRSAAIIGGHSPLIIRGMSEIDIELAVVEGDDRPVVVEAKAGSAGTVLKQRGHILTLTADEAVACGLSSGIVGGVNDIRSNLGVSAWRHVLPEAGAYIASRARSEQREAAIAREQAARQAARDAELRQRAAERQRKLDRIAPELSYIESRLAQLDAQEQAARATEQEILLQQNQQLQALNADYGQARNDLLLRGASPSEHSQLNAELERQRAVIAADYQARITGARERANSAALEGAGLRRRRAELTASAPR